MLVPRPSNPPPLRAVTAVTVVRQTAKSHRQVSTLGSGTHTREPEEPGSSDNRFLDQQSHTSNVDPHSPASEHAGIGLAVSTEQVGLSSSY